MPEKEKIALAATRIIFGLFLAWSFFDKLFGLGFSTAKDKSWLAGVSPTQGFLQFGARGPFKEFYASLAGNAVVDVLFMAGLLLIGLALLLGIGMRIACYSGALLFLLMYFALMPPEFNPVIDEHIIYAAVMFVLEFSGAGKTFGFGEWWSARPLVKRFTFLE